MAMAAAAACLGLGRRKIVPTLACTMIMRRWGTTRTVLVSTQERFVSNFINGQDERRWAAAEKSRRFILHPRRYYGTSPFSLRDMERSSRSTGDYNYDLAVDKAIEHYHKHIKVEEEDGRSVMMYPERGAIICEGGVTMFHIFLKTTEGQKYVSIYIAPHFHHLSKLDDGALRLVFFGKVHNNIPLPFRRVVGGIRWPVCPRNDPLITAAARFALAQHNKEEKLAHLIRATGQMVADYEIFRMTFKSEFSSMYDAIVLVPRNNPEKMELVTFRISNGWGMYGRLMLSYGSKIVVPYIDHLDWYEYEDGDGDEGVEQEDYENEYQYEGDECVIDDPRVTAAARFALAQYNEKDRVRLDNKKDQVRRVVEATRRTYSGDEILSMRFDGELDGSWFYKAIVVVPMKDPEDMRLAYCGRNYDDLDPYTDDYDCESDVDEDGYEECRIDDPRVTEAARLALATYNRKDKLLRVVKATSQTDSGGDVTYTVRLVGQEHPLRTYVAMVSAPVMDPYLAKFTSAPIKDPPYMLVKHVFPEVHGPSGRVYSF